MVDGVADHVEKRIGEFLGDGFVKFGFLAADFKLDLLTLFAG